VGTGRLLDFESLVFETSDGMRAEQIITGKRDGRQLFWREDADLKLFVLPHFSSPSGLNDDAGIQFVGQFIRNRLGLS
jgi:hypothetical protein